MLSLAKPIREECPDYLELVRTLPCCLCGAPSEPHHLKAGGVGTKGPDMISAPLCRRCHRAVEDRGEAFLMEEGSSLAWLMECSAVNLAAWVFEFVRRVDTYGLQAAVYGADRGTLAHAVLVADRNWRRAQR